jgi:hypothetical protein
VAILHGGRDDARRRRGHECLCERGIRDQLALRLHLRRLAVRDFGDGGGSGHQVDFHATESRKRELDEVGVVEQVTHEWPLAGVTEPGHAVLDVGEEALARLLAVVADVDPGRELSGDARRGRVLDCKAQLLGLNRFPPAAAAVQLGQRGRSGQAPVVGRENAGLAGEHGQQSPSPGVAPLPRRCSLTATLR